MSKSECIIANKKKIHLPVDGLRLIEEMFGWDRFRWLLCLYWPFPILYGFVDRCGVCYLVVSRLHYFVTSKFLVEYLFPCLSWRFNWISSNNIDNNLFILKMNVSSLFRCVSMRLVTKSNSVESLNRCVLQYFDTDLQQRQHKNGRWFV